MFLGFFFGVGFGVLLVLIAIYREIIKTYEEAEG